MLNEGKRFDLQKLGLSKRDVETGSDHDLVRQFASELSTRGIHHKRVNWIDNPTVILEKRELNSYAYTTIMLYAYENGSIKVIVISGQDSQPLGELGELYLRVSSPLNIMWDLQELGLFDFRK